MPKGAWIAIVVLTPVLGGILWFVIGRRRPATRRACTRSRPTMTPSSSVPCTTEQDERIRRLEEEQSLALDDESDGPGADSRS